MNIRDFAKLTGPVRRRVSSIVTRAVLGLIDDAAKMQALQVTLRAGRVLDGVEHFQHYGFTSHPFPGAEGIALAVGAHRAHTVVIAVDDRRYRLKSIAQGEVALYDDQGNVIILERSQIRVTAVQHLEIEAPTTHVTGTLTVDGLITGKGGLAISGGDGASVDGPLTTTGDVTAAGVSLDAHTHPGDSGGTTGAPN